MDAGLDFGDLNQQQSSVSFHADWGAAPPNPRDLYANQFDFGYTPSKNLFDTQTLKRDVDVPSKAAPVNAQSNKSLTAVMAIAAALALIW
jgi:hypothetical protein